MCFKDKGILYDRTDTVLYPSGSGRGSTQLSGLGTRKSGIKVPQTWFVSSELVRLCGKCVHESYPLLRGRHFCLRLKMYLDLSLNAILTVVSSTCDLERCIRAIF